MNEKLYDMVMKLPKKNIVNLMWEALSYMEQYNGRTRQACILMALGATQLEDGRWRLPGHEKARENTETMGL